PVKVFDDETQRASLALSEQHAADRVPGAIPALTRVEPLPPGIVHRHVEYCKDRGQGRQRLSEVEEAARDLLTNAPEVVALFEVEVASQQSGDGPIGRARVKRRRKNGQHAPLRRQAVRGELVDEARLAHPGLADERDDLAVAA